MRHSARGAVGVVAGGPAVMHLLTPQVMHYAWGSHDRIAALTGRPGPTEQPEAELWMGAHEHAPSGVVVDGAPTTLDAAIASDPARMLGGSCAARFDGRLPFLLKVLAPRQPLSIQCHPDVRQVRGALPGTYADGWPKPEAWLALTEFEVFTGTRPFEEVRSMASALQVEALVERVEVAACDGHPLHTLLSDLLRLKGDDRITLVRGVVAACRARSKECAGAAAVVARVADLYPDDMGLVVLLLMQHRVLAPGSYVFVPAGVLHTPVRGAVVEILANSDNVVRAGLTPKKLDIEELLRIVDVDMAMEPAVPVADGRVRSFPSDTELFQLHTVTPGEVRQPVPGTGRPRILLALHDSVALESAAGRLRLDAGQSCFAPASEGRVAVSGGGELFVATTGPVGAGL